MAGQFPHASAAGVEIGGDIGIDQIGLAKQENRQFRAK
jgi:hypothetical protein